MKHRHRITFISGQLDVGGQERALYLLLRQLDGRFDPEVISLTSGGHWGAEIRALGIPVVEIARKRSWQFGRLWSLAENLRKRNPSVVYCLGYSANTYGRLAGIWAGVRRLVAGWRGLEASVLRAPLEIALSRRTDRVVCNSDAVRQNILAYYPIESERVVVIRNGVEPCPPPDPARRASLRAELGVGPDEVLVGSVARLTSDKNLDLLIETALRVRAAKHDVRFLLAGGGPLRNDIMARLRSLESVPALELLGERPDARELMACFDLFLLTSHREGLPNAVLEAMAAGIPCVTTAVGGCREVVIDGETGFLVPPGDAGLAASRVLELAASKPLRSRLGDRGRVRALQAFSLERVTREHEALFDELTA